MVAFSRLPLGMPNFNFFISCTHAPDRKSSPHKGDFAVTADLLVKTGSYPVWQAAPPTCSTLKSTVSLSQST